MEAATSQSQEELQQRMASLVAELRGVMIQMGGAPAPGIAAAAAAIPATTAAAAPDAMSGKAAPSTAVTSQVDNNSTPPPASSQQQQQRVPAEVDSTAAFSTPFSVTSGSVSASLDQDIANLFSASSGGPTTQKDGGGGGAAFDADKWMHMFSAMNQHTHSEEMMQQFLYAQGFHGGARGRGGGRRGGGIGVGRFGQPMYGGHHNQGRGAFPPSGAHFVGNQFYGPAGYDYGPQAYGSEDGADVDMMGAMYALYEQFHKMQRQQQQQQQQPINQSNSGKPQGVNNSAQQGPKQSTQPATTATNAAPGAGGSTAATFRPNLSAKPFRPPNAEPLYGSPIPSDNDAVMRESFSAFKEFSVGGQKEGGDSGEEEIHYATGAAAPRKRRSRKHNGPTGAAVDEDDDSNTPMGYVEFKRQKIKKYPCQGGVIQPGQYVMVDGDRGLDCGLLVQMSAPNSNGALNVVALEGFELEDPKMKHERGRIIRIAENQEVDKLHNEICSAEKTALRACRQRCQELGLKIEVLDCEYQFDMKKVSFYFNSDKSVDFRDLVRDLYRNFGARIWMENINPNVKNVVPHGSRHH